MPQTYNFAELDRETHEYLLEVRDKQGKGMPGVFAAIANSWPVLGCICGPILIVVTLIGTLTDVAGVVLDEPNRVAFLQTAGIVLGGWMIAAAFRSWFGKRSASALGHWVYVDALHLYHVRGSQVAIGAVHDIKRAAYTHRYNNDTYQKTDVEIRFPEKDVSKFSITGEEKAERFVAFVNYMVFVYGPDGGKREDLPPDQLGMLARHVAKNDDEPLDENGNPDMSRVSGDYEGVVPEGPERARRSPPHLLPYLITFVCAVLCYFIMREVDVPRRDDAIFEAVSQSPVEPRYLRAYLIDPRNTNHRDDAHKQLATFYDPVEVRLRGVAPKTELRTGFADLIHSLREADQPIVSIRVTETKSPAGAGGGEERAKNLREEFPKRIASALTPISRSIIIPAGMTITPPPPPVGEQLLAFVEAPTDAAGAHFDIAYWFEPQANNRYEIQCRMEMRVKIEEKPVASYSFAVNNSYAANQTDAAVNDLLKHLINDLTVPGQVVLPPGPFPPGLQLPKF